MQPGSLGHGEVTGERIADDGVGEGEAPGAGSTSSRARTASSRPSTTASRSRRRAPRTAPAPRTRARPAPRSQGLGWLPATGGKAPAHDIQHPLGQVDVIERALDRPRSPSCTRTPCSTRCRSTWLAKNGLPSVRSASVAANSRLSLVELITRGGRHPALDVVAAEPGSGRPTPPRRGACRRPARRSAWSGRPRCPGRCRARTGSAPGPR